MDEDPSSPDRPSPQLPLIDERMPARFVPAPHPSAIDPEELFQRCEFRVQRRSGPGGQHRNKTSSGVFLKLVDCDMIAEATERRSQAQNRAVALARLRLRLAIELRSPSIFDEPARGVELQLRESFVGSRLKVSDSKPAKAALIAMILNDMHAAGGQPSLVASHWRCSTSATIALLQSHPPAFLYLNEIRRFHQRPPLR